MAAVGTEIPSDVMGSLCANNEDPDAALAKLFQEQEHAWFLANGGDPTGFEAPDFALADGFGDGANADTMPTDRTAEDPVAASGQLAFQSRRALPSLRPRCTSETASCHI
jgi:hypothetical protein